MLAAAPVILLGLALRPLAANAVVVAPPQVQALDPSEQTTIDKLHYLLSVRAENFAEPELLHLAITIDRAARRHRVDPYLVLAVIEKESNFKRWRKSPAGALGLMQLLPNTARAFARSLGVRWRGSKSLYDADANIEIGVGYIAWLLHRFDGDIPHALAAYCHGPGRVRKMLRRRGRLNAYRQRYARKVIRAWERYLTIDLAASAPLG